jgi:cell division protein FtsA
VEIIGARLEEVFELVGKEIKRSGYDGLLPAGVVLSGGVASTAGIVGLGQGVLKLPVRIGYPVRLDGLMEAIGSPAYATSVGLLLWGMKRDTAELDEPAPPRGWTDLYRRFTSWLKVLLPS